MNRDRERNVEQYLSTGRLMDMLGISRSTVYRLMQKGMPNIMVGKVHRFPRKAVLTWLRGRGNKEGTEEAQPEAVRR